MKKVSFLLFSLVCAAGVFAQDIHFSQFYNSPLTLNPALTGKMNGVFRFGLTYRNQWFTLSNEKTPFATYAGSFDMPIRFRKDALGVGLVLVNDQSGEGLMNNMLILASVAYHLGIGSSGKHSISLGVQGGYNQKRIDMGDLKFFSQFVNGAYNPYDPTTEGSLNDQKAFFDLNVGVIGNSKLTEKVNAYVGFAAFHLTQPKESLLESGDESLPMRNVVHAGVEYLFHKRVALLPSLIYMHQRKADELNLGTAFVFKMMENEKTLLYLGAYYRMLPSSKANGANFSDAIIPYAAFEYRNFKIGFTFDEAISDMTYAPKAAGAFEVSLTYTHPFLLPNMKTLLFCPRF